LEGSESNFSGNSNSIKKVSCLLEMHDRVLDQVVWEITILLSPFDFRVCKCHWWHTIVYFPPGSKSTPQSFVSKVNEKPMAYKKAI